MNDSEKLSVTLFFVLSWSWMSLLRKNESSTSSNIEINPLEEPHEDHHGMISPVRHRSKIFKQFKIEDSDGLSTNSPSQNITKLFSETDEQTKLPNIQGLSLKKAKKTTFSTDVIIVGIAGGSGSGKTTLANAVYDNLGGEDNIAFISHDSYYKDISHLTFAEREKQNFDHPDSLDTDLLIEHLMTLKKKGSVQVPIYDYSTHSRMAKSTEVKSKPIVLLEGILIFTNPQLAKLLDIKIFVDTESDIRFIRRIQRDTIERGRTIEGVVNQYINTVRPMHLEHVEPSKRTADIIVPVGLNNVALDLVVSRLHHFLAPSSDLKLSPLVDRGRK